MSARWRRRLAAPHGGMPQRQLGGRRSDHPFAYHRRRHGSPRRGLHAESGGHRPGFATKSDRMHWFDRRPEAAIFDGAFNVPMLWNSNFFMTSETMKILRLLVDVWLPDLKFGPGRCATSSPRRRGTGRPSPAISRTSTIAERISLSGTWSCRITSNAAPIRSSTGWPSICPRCRSTSWINIARTTFAIRAAPRIVRNTPSFPVAPPAVELRDAYRRARALRLRFETVTFEKYATEFTPATLTL